MSVDALLESLDRAQARAVEDALAALPFRNASGCRELGKGKRLVILVISGHLSYEKRVKPILETWGHELPNHVEMIVVGDEPNEALDIHATPCRTKLHGGGLCCKLAHGFSHVVSEAFQYDWLLVVDDDTYINVPEWQWRLSRLHGENNSRRIFGLRGCGKWQDTCPMPGRNSTPVTEATAQELCCGGLCGGAGMAFSRSAAEWIAFQGQAKGMESLRGFSKEFHKTCLRCRQHGDKAFTILAMRYNVSMETLPFAGMHLGRPKGDKFNETLLDCRRPIVTVHFLKSTQDYARIHDMLQEHPTERCRQRGHLDLLPRIPR